MPARGHGASAGFAYAIVDEVDSILIDEARTPLIISGPIGGQLGTLSPAIDTASSRKLGDEDFEKDEKTEAPSP